MYTKYIDPGNQRSDDITDALEKAISPSARLIVYYVDKTSNEIVADSVKFSVKRQCQGKEVITDENHHLESEICLNAYVFYFRKHTKFRKPTIKLNVLNLFRGKYRMISLLKDVK